MTRRSLCRRTSRRGRPAPAAFTLVELLVVITIIGILVGMLVPAVQAARESGRRTVCKNNVTQLMKACMLHETRLRHLPSGGWGSGWVGEPTRGFGKEQPGGWIYNVLPFLEKAGLHDLGKDGDGDTATAETRERLEFPLPFLYCPTRRKAKPYVYSGNGYLNPDCPVPGMVGLTDYAACGGNRSRSGECEWPGPESIPKGDQMSERDWNGQAGTSRHASGVIYRRSKVKYGSIRDGESFTYLVGEKYLKSTLYEDYGAEGNNDTWSVGYDYDVIRWTNANRECRARRDNDPADSNSFVSEQAFGSPHSAGFHMGFCDGSVRSMHFSIDRQVHSSLGHKSDSAPSELPME